MKVSYITKQIAILLVIAGFSVSCNKEVKQEERKIGEVPPTSNPAFMNLDAAGATPPANATPVTNNNPQMQPATTTTAPGMNPPHGQPGHRCEIAVGAPLNSQPTQQPAQAQQPPAQFMPPAAQQPSPANAVATAPGMNPPHGQPGHSCAIAVGAPLPKG